MTKTPAQSPESVTLDLELIQLATSYLEAIGSCLKHEPIRKLVKAIDAQLSRQM